MKNFFYRFAMLPAMLMGAIREISAAPSCFPVVYNFNSNPVNDSLLDAGGISFIRTLIGPGPLHLQSISLDITGGEFVSFASSESCEVTRTETHAKAKCHSVVLYKKDRNASEADTSITFTFMALRASNISQIIPTKVSVECDLPFDWIRSVSLLSIDQCVAAIEAQDNLIASLMDALIYDGLVGGGALLILGACLYANRAALKEKLREHSHSNLKVMGRLLQEARRISPGYLGVLVVLVVLHSIGHGYGMPTLLSELYERVSNTEDKDVNVNNNGGVLNKIFQVAWATVTLSYMGNLSNFFLTTITRNTSRDISEKVINKIVAQPANARVRKKIYGLLPGIESSLSHVSHNYLEISESFLEIICESGGFLKHGNIRSSSIFIGSGFAAFVVNYFILWCFNSEFNRGVASSVDSHHHFLERMKAIQSSQEISGDNQGEIARALRGLDNANNSYLEAWGVHSLGGMFFVTIFFGIALSLSAISNADRVNNSHTHYTADQFEHDLFYLLFFYKSLMSILDKMYGLKLPGQEVRECLEFLDMPNQETALLAEEGLNEEGGGSTSSEASSDGPSVELNAAGATVAHERFIDQSAVRENATPPSSSASSFDVEVQDVSESIAGGDLVQQNAPTSVVGKSDEPDSKEKQVFDSGLWQSAAVSKAQTDQQKNKINDFSL